MPIQVSVPIDVLDQEQFHALDQRIIGIVFDVHNEFGRLMDEELYKREIAARCAAMGLVTEREVRIRVSHEDFIKDYSMDLLVSRGYMLEGKAAELLVPAHRGQSLNYILMAGMRHARLVNFRTERVEHEFISTTLTPEERRRFTVEDRDWIEESDRSRFLKEKTIELLQDWGAFLDVNLYREGLVHFLGGAAAVTRPIEIFRGSRAVGTQRLNLVTDEEGFALTMLPGNSGAMREHLRRLLEHTGLRHIHWINLNRHRVEFATLSSGAGLNLTDRRRNKNHDKAFSL
jgi:GxxExxY protein